MKSYAVLQDHYIAPFFIVKYNISLNIIKPILSED